MQHDEDGAKTSTQGMVNEDRRKLLKGAAAVTAAAVAPAIWTSAVRAQNRTLVVRDPAGPYVKAMTEGFYAPFEKATGVKIERVTADHEPTSQVKAMVETKNYFWDVVVLSMGAYGVVAEQGLVEPLSLDEPATVVEPHVGGQ